MEDFDLESFTFMYTESIQKFSSILGAIQDKSAEIFLPALQFGFFFVSSSSEYQFNAIFLVIFST